MLCQRVQGLRPRAHIPRGPDSFVLLNPPSGSRQGTDEKTFPRRHPSWEPPVGRGKWREGQEGGLTSQHVNDSQKTCFQETEGEKSQVSPGPLGYLDTLGQQDTPGHTEA